MNNFELVTQLRDLMVGSGSSQSLLRRASVLGAFCSLLVLGACGKSASTLSPDGQNLGATGARTGDGATSSAGQPSAKFAYSSAELALIKQTSATNGWVTVLSCPIKTPAAKEVYVSASLETGLFTQTLVRSKNNKKDTSTASVAIQVQALIDGSPMEPGTVTYAARTQTLTATLEGAIGGCLKIINNADGTQTIVVDQDCVTPEEIGLILSTLNAASFGFVSTNVPVGTHVISLQARITSTTSVDTGTATAEALVGKGTMICEVLRAVN